MPQTDIGTELRQAAPEPLLPVEKKLIGFSLGTGLVLLLALALLKYLLPATFCGPAVRRDSARLRRRRQRQWIAKLDDLLDVVAVDDFERH
jgi:hypothetical protein